jgi:cyanophycin synthetase
MKITETKVMRGPNQWSIDEKQLIVLKVEIPDEPESVIKDFLQKLVREFPGLPGKLLQEERGQVAIVHALRELALELQQIIGLKCRYARSKEGHEKNEYFVVFSYEIEQVGLFAGEAATEIVDDLLLNRKIDREYYTDTLFSLRKRYSMGPTTSYILNEVIKRGIPYRQFDHGSLIMLGHGLRQKKIRTAVTDTTSGLGMEMAGDKEETKKLLDEANLPVPKGIIVYDEHELEDRINEVRFPIVLKPLDGNHGRGVTTDINSLDRALFGFEIAKKVSTPVIVEEFVKGDDYRFLVINYKLVAVAHRMPAYVTGDGASSVQELIDQENRHPQRGDSSDHVLAFIKVDDVTRKILSEKNLTLDSVVPKGQRIILKDTANISAGGTATDVTDIVHPDNRFMVERVARMFNLDICGVDIMATAVDVPITRDIGAIIEVNAGPGIRMHSNPQNGAERNVAAPIIDMLFPNTEASKIPIVAVTGTNGKTTTCRLISYMAQNAGFKPGVCTTEGIYIDGHYTYKGDCTGYKSAQQVLFDPSIDFAVLETARGGIIRSGLGFDECDISIFTNISEDHMGLKDIHTIEDLLRVKSVVPFATREDGYAILNADDNRVYSLYDKLKCRIALFSLDPNNDRVREHIKNNGMAAVIENGQVTVMSGHKITLGKVQEFPLTYHGKAEFMTENILASVLAAMISGFDQTVIKESLMTFVPTPSLAPGRLNLFDFGDFKLMVDYVHNVDGFTEIKKFLAKVEERPKTGIICIAGDRRDEDIRAVGMLAATTFDKIIIRHDKTPRQRSGREVENLLTEGVLQINSRIPLMTIPDEKEAINRAIEEAEKGSFIFVCADKVHETLAYVAKLHAKREGVHAHD